MELIQYDKPTDRARAFIRDYAGQLYGIAPHLANAMAPLVEIAFDQAQRAEHRIRAASELLKYSEVPTRAIEYDGGKQGPDLEVTVLGTCRIEAPSYGPTDQYPQQLVSPCTSDSLVELSNERGQEGS